MKLPIIYKSTKGRLSKSLYKAKKRLKEHEKKIAGKTRIGFIIDATGSRASTWLEAQKIQARMFKSLQGNEGLTLRLIHFGGNRVKDHGWLDSTTKIAALMNEVKCKTGLTKYINSINYFLHDLEHQNARSIILVGDHFEEDQENLFELARKLASKDIKVFCFLDSDDEKAEQTFRFLSETTAGKFARFGEDLPLSDLCEAVALLSSDTPDSVKKIKNENVKRLLLKHPDNKEHK